MAMGKRRRSRQEAMWVETGSLPAAPGHPFYEALNELLAKHGFDDFVEELCAPQYAAGTGRPSLPPGVYFRCLMIGYFEGLDSERGIDWRVADSLTLRHFLGYDLTEPTPDHSTLSKTRRRLSAELHQEVFTWILALLAKEGLLKGRTVGVDATNLEANAALRSIVRRDTGEGYQEYLARLAEASGVETPTRQDRAQVDKKRPKKGSNDDWKHPHDPEARITKMADGRTRLAHKLEHTVDLDTQAIVSVQVSGADVGDPDTLGWSLVQADWNLTAASKDARARRHLARAWLTEVVTDKGYHSNATLKTLTAAGIRTHLSEPDRGRRRWRGDSQAQAAVHANRRRVRSARGRTLQKRRGEYNERSFAHTLATGRMRRVHLRGHLNIYKRVCIHAVGFNLGLVMRQLVGAGTPRGLPALRWAFRQLQRALRGPLRALGAIPSVGRTVIQRVFLLPKIPSCQPLGRPV